MTETGGGTNVPYKDQSLSPQERAADLLARMTREEKVGQLQAYWMIGAIPTASNNEKWLRYRAMSEAERNHFVMAQDISQPVRAGMGHFTVFLRDIEPQAAAWKANQVQEEAMGNTRLGIPVMIHDEGLHGLLANSATIFPQAIALSCTWDAALVEEIAAVIGREARSRGIRQLLSPTINIARDGRAGRTEETFGEDPYLTSRLAVAYVRGLQSQGVIATPKHFAANFVGDGGRDSHAIHFSEQLMRDVYFPAFKAAVTEGGALSLMAAYNSIDGQPCSCNPWLLREVLTEEWGFQGYVVSDYHSLLDVYARHGVARSPAEAAKRALEAGLDVEFPYVQCFGSDLLNGLENGSISEGALDRATRRVLEAKFRIGLFDEPFVDEAQVSASNHTDEHQALALRAARQSIVLLKNSAGTLPLAASTRSLAVIGPLADIPSLGGYTWDLVPRQQVVTPLDGLRMLAGETQIHYLEGCRLTGPLPNGIEAAANLARKCDAAVLFVGNTNQTEGEGRDRADLTLPGVQADLIQAVAATGTPTVVVLINGSPIILKDWIESVSAVLEAWYPGEQGGAAIAEVLLGKTSPSGKLTISFPRSVGQLPLYYNPQPSGRSWGYADESGAALFPFGHGLSYTSFAYHGLEITQVEAERFRVSLEVQNSGEMEGDEVVQLYIHDVLATLSRPVKELKDFQRIHLKPGETGRVTFDLPASRLGYHDREGQYIVEPGAFEVLVGSSSEDIRLAGELVLG